MEPREVKMRKADPLQLFSGCRTAAPTARTGGQGRPGAVLPLLFFAIALSLYAGSGSRYLEGITPDMPKKPEEGYSLDGKIYRFQNASLKVELEYLDQQERADYYREHKIDDPFRGFSQLQNLIPIRARFENLQKEGDIFMSPNTVVLGNIPTFDDTKLYQLLYQQRDNEKRLEAAGATLFIRPLSLPPGTWIERIFMFQYDDSLPVKRLSLVIASVMGTAEWDLEFKYKATFKKEKS